MLVGFLNQVAQFVSCELSLVLGVIESRYLLCRCKSRFHRMILSISSRLIASLVRS